MILEINDLEKVILKVNEGSGILLNFEADKKSYVLTAYHNIKTSIDNTESIDIFNDNDELYSIIGKPYCDTSNDFSLIEINFIPNSYKIDYEKNIKPDIEITFMGYPDKANKNRKRLNGKVIEWNSKTAVNVTENINGSSVNKEKANEILVGFSGSGVFKKDEQKLSLIGILKSLPEEDFDYKEISCVPIEKIIQFIQYENLAEESFLNPLVFAWDNLDPKNERNLNDKLKVCTNISSTRIQHYIRMVSIGKSEQSRYSSQDISTIKYMIWEKCHEELMDFIDKDISLTFEEIKNLLSRYLLKAKKIINDKREEYKYGNFSDDIIEKIILDLIDECYLSFDKEGIYE